MDDRELRDRLAAMAMSGIMSNPDHADSTQNNARGCGAVAVHAYMVADALLAERQKAIDASKE